MSVSSFALRRTPAFAHDPSASLLAGFVAEPCRAAADARVDRGMDVANARSGSRWNADTFASRGLASRVREGLTRKVAG
jgi:hypothetical protein